MKMAKKQTYTELIEVDHIDLFYLTDRMYILLSKHIGNRKAISRTKIFKHFFGDPEEYNAFQQSYLWKRLSQTISYIRRKTNCFVISQQTKNDYYFFVVKTKQEAKLYHKKADTDIKGRNRMKQRLTIAVRDNWYAKVAQEAEKKKKRLKELEAEE